MSDVFAQGDGTRGEQALVIAGLDVMKALQQILKIGAGAGRGVMGLRVVANALKPPRDIEQASIKSFIPMPGKSDFGERRIEGGTMSIPFSIGEGSVYVENECAQGHD